MGINEFLNELKGEHPSSVRQLADRHSPQGETSYFF